jgi:hypothetical protein
MTFARIRSLRTNRRNTPSPVASPPPKPITKVNALPENIEIDDELPMEEIAIDLTQQEDTDETGRAYPPRSLEFWSVDSKRTIPTCNCGLTANGLLCFTDGLCGIIPDPPGETPTVERKKPQSPFFLKVDRVDPNRTGFITPPRDRGDVCSLSRAVSELEEVDAEKRMAEVKAYVEQKQQQRVLNTVKSLHLQVGPLEKNEENDKSQVVVRDEAHPKSEVEAKNETVYKPKFSNERIRLPIRAGRMQSRDNAAAYTDDVEASSNGQVDYRVNTRAPANFQATSRTRISRLPVRAGRVTAIQETQITTEPTSSGSGRYVPRRGFIERRRCLIAATKKQEEPIIQHPRDEKYNMDEIPLIDISHNVSFENEEEIEAAMGDFENNHCTGTCGKSEMFRGESDTTKGSLDYTTTSSHETLEETFEETIEEDSQAPSSLDFEGEGTVDDRITKAGWITRQLYREGRRDRIEGAQSVELVYTLG